MKKNTNLLIIKSFLLVLFLSVTNVYAADTADNGTPKVIVEKTYSIAVKHLTKELQNAFDDKTVVFKIANLHQEKLNQKDFRVEGDGFAVFKSENDNLPLHFSFSTDSSGVKVSDLTYEFLQADTVSAVVESDDAPDKVESTLMREIMSRIHKDYKTTDIVIAIDDFQKIDPQNNTYKGSGEVRIGGMMWKQIDFEVKLDDKNKTAKDVNYKLEK